jgi:FkbM family methyltransferase
VTTLTAIGAAGRGLAENLGSLVGLAAHGVNSGVLAVRRAVLGQRFIERRVHDYRLVLDSYDPGVCRQLLERGTREPEQKYLLEQALKPGMTAFDLGANAGYYTVMMAKRVGEAGRVYAVEPLLQSFTLLERNVRLNGLDNVQLEQIAIADQDGVRDLLLTAESNWHSFQKPELATRAPWCSRYERRIVDAIPVRTQALANFLADKEPIDFLRMDLEGFETVILDAICNLEPATRARLHILMETHPEFYSPANDMRRVLTRLCKENGYEVSYVVSDFHFRARRHRPVELGAELFRRRGYDERCIVRQFRNRAIYAGIELDDAIDLISTSECVHAALLAPDGSDLTAYAL